MDFFLNNLQCSEAGEDLGSRVDNLIKLAKEDVDGLTPPQAFLDG